MAVLVEAVSVIIRKDSIARVFDGWPSFVAVVPNNTFCDDDDLVRIGFMAESDALNFVESLGKRGLALSGTDPSRDVAVVDQIRGLPDPCDWLDCVRVEIGKDQRVLAGLMRGRPSDMLSCPAGWTFERSLSSTYGFAPEVSSSGLRLLRHENGLDIYWNDVTQEEVYVGRCDLGER